MSLACPNCGSSPDPRDLFCGTCGHPVRVHAARARRDVPEPRAAHDAWWDGGPARTKTRPRPAPASATPEAPRSARASARPADPQSCITADDRRMGYKDLDVSATLDPLSNSRFLWQLARRFGLYFAVSSVIDFALFVLAFIITVSEGGLAGLANGGGAFSAVEMIDLLITAALLAMFLFMPVPARLGQWSRVLSFQAPAATSALERVRQALEQHATPYDKLGLRPLAPPGEGRRDYLELRQGYFAGYVSCFPHGHDLYAGWTFWIYISPVRLFLMRIGRRFQDYTGRGNDMYQTLRYEPARATIAALHTCTLEGVDAATGGTPEPDGNE